MLDHLSPCSHLHSQTHLHSQVQHREHTQSGPWRGVGLFVLSPGGCVAWCDAGVRVAPVVMQVSFDHAQYLAETGYLSCLWCCCLASNSCCQEMNVLVHPPIWNLNSINNQRINNNYSLHKATTLVRFQKLIG